MSESYPGHPAQLSGGHRTRAGPPGLTPPRRRQPRQQPRQQPRRRGRGGPGVHVTTAVPPRRPSPLLPRPRPTRAARLRRSRARLLRRDGRWTTGFPAKPPARPPPQSSEASRALRGGRRLPSSPTRRSRGDPASPRPRPRTRREASDTPAGARPPLPARAGSRPRPLPHRGHLQAPESCPALGAGDRRWRLSKGGGIAHAQKPRAPHSGTTLPRSLDSNSISDDI